MATLGGVPWCGYARDRRRRGVERRPPRAAGRSRLRLVSRPARRHRELRARPAAVLCVAGTGTRAGPAPGRRLRPDARRTVRGRVGLAIVRGRFVVGGVVRIRSTGRTRRSRHRCAGSGRAAHGRRVARGAARAAARMLAVSRSTPERPPLGAGFAGAALGAAQAEHVAAAGFDQRGNGALQRLAAFRFKSRGVFVWRASSSLHGSARSRMSLMSHECRVQRFRCFTCKSGASKMFFPAFVSRYPNSMSSMEGRA